MGLAMGGLAMLLIKHGSKSTIPPVAEEVIETGEVLELLDGQEVREPEVASETRPASAERSGK